MDKDSDFSVPANDGKPPADGPVTDPVRAGKAAPKGGKEPKAAKSKPQAEEPAGKSDAPRFDPSASQPVIHPTAEQMLDTFRAQSEAAAQHALHQLAIAHPVVRELIAENRALKAELAKLKEG